MATFSHNCPYCKITNTAFTVKFQQPIHDQSGKFLKRFELFATCNHCGKGIVSSAKVNLESAPSFNFTNAGPLHDTNLQIIGEWFPKPDPIDIPDHLPDGVKKAFNDGCKVIDISVSSACAMFRKAIDLATKDIAEFDAHNLQKRINKLAIQHRITQDIADWATQIALDGNFSLHESEPTKEQAEDLKSLTEYFLRYVYTLPEQVRLARERSKKESGN
jgi:hypothetical protein